MTDDRPADWVNAARTLPRGSLVIVRARQRERRRALAKQLGAIATILVADDPHLAEMIGAKGVHLPQRRMREAQHWRARHPSWIITASAHSLRALMGTTQLDAVFLSPVFATTSHPKIRPLTPVRAALIAARAQLPIYALGGVTPHNAMLLAPVFSGIAAISSLVRPHQN